MKSATLFTILLLCANVYAQVPESDMALIPAGDFIMGKNTSNTSDWQPEHKISVKSFLMDKYEVTNKQYYEYCRKTNTPLPEFWGSSEVKCSLDYPDFPVIGVSSTDAAKYAAWIGKRLPTEAEWEYAARGGLKGQSFPWGDQIDSTKANYGKKYKSTLKVGSFSPNGYGLFDMSGNVWEWTADYYGHDFYINSPENNPTGPIQGRFRVIRGGSWHSGAMCQQIYYRNGLPVSWVDFAVGFRCVKDIK